MKRLEVTRVIYRLRVARLHHLKTKEREMLRFLCCLFLTELRRGKTGLRFCFPVLLMPYLQALLDKDAKGMGASLSF